MKQLDLTKEILDEMKRQEIDESIIKLFTDSEQYRYALGKSSNLQRSLLTSILFRILLYLKVRLPPELRILLTIDQDNNEWLISIKNNIIPFIKLNSLTLIKELKGE